MATVGDYITGQLKKYRLSVDDTEMEVILLKYNLTPTDEVTKENVYVSDLAIVGMIPELLLSPDKTTGDTSLKFDRTAIYRYYALKCAELGVPDLLAQENSITDISDTW